MSNDSPLKALIVVFAVALVCSMLVSTAAITLRPVQLQNQLVERSRNIVALTGLVAEGATVTDDEILEAVGHLDVRAVDIDTGEFESSIDPDDFDARAAAGDPELGEAVPAEYDVARIGRRARFAVVYLVWVGDTLDRVILPIYGQGMWSTLYGYIALESDLNTIAAVTFYEQAETAGLGDQITRPGWHARWVGRRIFDDAGAVRFRVAAGAVPEASPGARHEVDGLTGATVTGSAVTALIAYWFGPHGYAEFLEALKRQPPVRAGANGGQQ